jgi:anti-sigma factor RsiW
LLPWYVNGTLDAKTRRQADRHLEDCEICRQDYVTECQIAASIQERTSTPTQTPHAGWERFAARLDDPAPLPSDPHALHLQNRSTAAGPNRPRRRWLIALAVGQAAAIAVLIVALFAQSKNAEPVNTFSTLSAPDSTLAVPGDLVRLAFASPPPATEIERLTQVTGARVVSGPTANNVYTLALDGNVRRGDARASVLTWLQQQPGVVLVEPVERTDTP